MRLLNVVEVQNELLDLMKKLHAFLGEKAIAYYLLGGSALGAVRHKGFIPWDDDIDIGMVRDEYERFLSFASEFDSTFEIVNFKTRKKCDFCLTRVYINGIIVDDPATRKTCLDHRLYLDIFPLDNVPDSDAELSGYEKKIVRRKKMMQRIDARDYGKGRRVLLLKKGLSFVLRPWRQRILKRTDRLMKKYRGTKTARICSLSSQYSFARQVMDKATYGTPVLMNFCDTMFYVPEKTEEYLTTLFGANYMDVPPEHKRRKGNNIYRVEG